MLAGNRSTGNQFCREVVAVQTDSEPIQIQFRTHVDVNHISFTAHSEYFHNVSRTSSELIENQCGIYSELIVSSFMIHSELMQNLRITVQIQVVTY